MAVVINGNGTVTGLAVGGLPDGIVDSGTLATNSVDSAELIDGAVDNSHLADDAVDSDEIAAGAIDAAHLASGVGGKVLQVVYANPSKTSQVVSAGVPSELTTDLRIAITPQSSTSKLYFDFAAPFVSDDTNALTYAYFYNVTDTAVVNEPPASGSRRRAHWSMRTTAVDANDNNMLNMSTVESSSSTSARTYTIYHGSATSSYDVQFYVSTLSTGDGSVTQPLFKITEVEV